MAGLPTMTVGVPHCGIQYHPFFRVSFYCKPSKKQGVLHEMYEILREMYPGQIDSIEFRNYD